MRRVAMIVIIGLTLAWLAPAAHADAELDGLLQQIREEYTAAAAENRVPDNEKLLELFKQIISRDPSNDDALHAISVLGNKVVLDSIYKSGGREALITELLRRAERARLEQVNNADEIMAQVAKLDSDDMDTRWGAISVIINRYGEYAIPYIIGNLSTDTVENSRTGAIVCLGKMGMSATMALLEGLKAEDVTIRQSTAALLGNIRDDRALPALQALVERNGADSPDGRYAADAIAKILGSEAGDLPPAKALYVDYADKFYKSSPDVMRQPKYHTIWNWDETAALKLVGTPVPLFSVNERWAEKFCYEALALDSEYTPAWSLLTCCFYKQEIEAHGVLKGATKRLDNGVTQDDLNTLGELANQLYKVRGLSTAAGKDMLYAALTKSLLDNEPETAVAVLESLQQVEDGSDFPAALEGDGYAASIQLALQYPEKRVRYAAAELLVKVNTLESFSNKELVLPALEQALSETALRVILIVSNNLEFRNRISGALSNLGHFPVQVTDRFEAVTRARGFPAEDLVIIDNRLNRPVGVPTENTDAFLLAHDIKNDFRTADIPVLLYDDLRADDAEALQRLKVEFGETIRDMIVSPDPDSYKELLDMIFAEREMDANRAMAFEAAAKAADTVASVDPQWSTYDLKQLVPALNGNLENRPANVVIASAKCLAKLADPRSESALARQFGNTALSIPEREAIAMALGEVLKHSRTISTDTVNILRETIHEGAKEIELAASHVVGCAALTPKARFEIYQAERPQLKK